MSSTDKKKLDSLPTIYNGSYTYSQAVPSKSPVKVTISVPTGYYNKPIYVNASGTANYGDWITALGAVWLDSTRIAVYLYNHGDGPSTGNININYMLTK